MRLNLTLNRNFLVFFVASIFLLLSQSAYAEDTCKSAMPDGYAASEIAHIRDEIRAAGGLFGTTFPRRELTGNPMIELFLGYASARTGDDFFALAHFEAAEIFAYERNYCNKKIVRELSSIGRYEVITRLEEQHTDRGVFKNLIYGTTFSPSGMNIRLFKEVSCLLFTSDIELVMSDTNYEGIYRKPECFGD